MISCRSRNSEGGGEGYYPAILEGRGSDQVIYATEDVFLFVFFLHNVVKIADGGGGEPCLSRP